MESDVRRACRTIDVIVYGYLVTADCQFEVFPGCAELGRYAHTIAVKQAPECLLSVVPIARNCEIGDLYPACITELYLSCVRSRVPTILLCMVAI